MSHKSGERLFEAIGQLAEELVLEAEQDGLESQAGPLQGQGGYGKKEMDGQAADTAGEAGGEAKPVWKGQKQQEVKSGSRKQGQRAARIEKIGGYLKYLPVAACLFLVFGGVYQIVSSYVASDKTAGYSMSDGMPESGGGAGDDRENASDRKKAEDMEESVGQDSVTAGGYGMDGDAGAGMAGAEGAQDGQSNDAGGGGQPEEKKPAVWYDDYKGPVLALTATGDTQNIKTSRKVNGAVTCGQPQEEGQGIWPLLQAEDVYRIKNTSNEDKTLQLVYPFTATLNQAYSLDGDVLEIAGQDNTAISYSAGAGIGFYQGKQPGSSDSVEDYKGLYGNGAGYQEDALQKAADWSREVSVYSFSDIRVDGDMLAGRQGIIGVTIEGQEADILTYGFNYNAQREDGTSDYCFFIPEEPDTPLYFIVTGEMDGEPQIGYYANLDCEEEADGIQCTMRKQEMPYADALYLCSKEAVKQVEQDYRQGLSKAGIPEYLDADAAYHVLTLLGSEDQFYNTLKESYLSTELKNIFQKLFGEARIIYALSTVTIPAGEAIQVTAHTQKRQDSSVYAQDDGSQYQFDFFPGTQSRLNIQKTSCRVTLSKEWELVANNMGLKQKKGRQAWEGSLRGKLYYFTVTQNPGR